mmetsp:Transcript_57691/g.66617  ORF Transcript_57691/g.66617 Transcript_57691/m.66617 type:complete len:183 (-) Transcript_57691:8-556(-)
MPFSLRPSASKIETRSRTDNRNKNGMTTIVTMVTKQPMRKTVRFRVPLLLNTDEEASIALALVEDVQQYHHQESHHRRMRREQDRSGTEEGNCTEEEAEEEDAAAYNSWYTATELHSFRSNISLTIINWMLLHEDLVSHDPADEERRSTPTTSTSNDEDSSISSSSSIFIRLLLLMMTMVMM